MRNRTPLVIGFVLLVALGAACITAPPHGPDPYAGLYLYPTDVEPVSLHEADLPLTAGVENLGDQPFMFKGELAVTSDGSLIDTVPFGQLATGNTATSKEFKTVVVHQVCSPGQTKVFTATIKYDQSITADTDAVDVRLTNNQSSTDDACPVIYERYLELFCEACVKKVNDLRALEKLQPLAPASLQHQACSNADAKANSKAGDPHANQCGQAQNTCSSNYGSFGAVLNTCIERDMYYTEKQNYQANPNGCYSAPWPATCGHYVNMTDKDNHGYNELACGLFVDPSEAPYLVLNFFT